MIPTNKLFRVCAAAAKLAERHGIAVDDALDPAQAIQKIHDELLERATSYRADVRELAKLAHELELEEPQDVAAANGLAGGDHAAR